VTLATHLFAPFFSMKTFDDLPTLSFLFPLFPVYDQYFFFEKISRKYSRGEEEEKKKKLLKILFEQKIVCQRHG